MIFLVQDSPLNFRILLFIFFFSGCGLKTLPTPPKKKFTPMEQQYIKRYEVKKEKNQDKKSDTQKKK